MDDRALVAALVAGDPRGLADAYRAYADRLYTYCRSVLRDPDLAADAVHDTFIIAGARAGQLRDPDRLRPWLYAIARNECRRLLRGRARQVPLAEAGEMAAPEVDPVTGLRAAELRELVWSAADGLNQGDREVFQLAVGHDLPPAELAAVLGVSVAHAHARLSRARAQLERSLGALLVARATAGECATLAALIADWDGRLTPLLRKRLGRHIDGCDVCGECQRRQLQPAALLPAYAGLPMLVAPAELWRRQELTARDPDRQPIRDGIVNRAGRFHPTTGFPHPTDRRRWWRRRRTAAVVAAAVLLLGSGVAAGATLPALPVFGPAGADQTGDQTAGSSSATEVAATSAAGSPTVTPSAATPAAPPAGASPSLAPPGGSTDSPTGPPPGSPPTGPTTPGRASPTLPPSPSPEEPPAALHLRATAEPRCTAPGFMSFVVTVRGSEPLAAGQVYWEWGTGSGSAPLTVDGSEATGRSTRLPTRAVTWWVEASTSDGRAGSTPRTSATC